jgi:hypothetical protein
MELSTEKSNTYESYMNKANQKFVRFNGIVNVIPIPDIESIFDIKDLIWYSDDDYKIFARDYIMYLNEKRFK